MQISGNLQTGTLQLSRPFSQAESWKVGQIIEAVALKTVHEGQARLQSGRHQFDVRTTLDFRAGDRLTLEVTAQGKQTVLRPVARQTEDVLMQAYRQSLPRQDRVTPLLANLSQLLQKHESSLPLPVREVAQHLLARLPVAADLVSGKALQHALKSSGLFLEATLARGDPLSISRMLTSDLKVALLALKQQLSHWPVEGIPKPAPMQARPAPPGQAERPLPPAVATVPGSDAATVKAVLSEQTDNALARIQLQQLASLPREGQQGLHWLLELPVQDSARSDLFHVHLEQEGAHKNDPAQHGWRVELQFDLEGLGAVAAQLSVTGNDVSVQFQSRDDSAVTRISEALEGLRADLQLHNLQPAVLSARQGWPQQRAMLDRTGIDIKA